jgi:hypothetical protein
MPNRDRRIGFTARGEDLVASWARTPGSEPRLIGHPLSLQPIRESLVRLLRISAPPPSPARTGGVRSVRVSLHLSVEWDGMRERTCF